MSTLQMFDAGRSSPLLSHLLSSGELQAKDKRVIVPGCGCVAHAINLVEQQCTVLICSVRPDITHSSTVAAAKY